MTKVALCTPSRTGLVRFEYMHSCVDVMNAAAKNDVKLLHLIGAGCSILPRVRNQLVANALEQGADWVFFVDDDIAFDAKDFFKLISHDVDVVGAGPARRHKRWDDKPACLGRPKDGPTVKAYKTDAGRLWEIDRLATAFIAIRSTVFKELEPVTEPYRIGVAGEKIILRTWFWFDLNEINGEVWEEGEDFNFCRKWAHVGGTCFLDPDIRLRHYEGSVCHDYCPADMEAEQQQIAAE